MYFVHINLLTLLLFYGPVLFADNTLHDFQFVDKTEETGLNCFKHRLGSFNKLMIVEAMGSGVAVGDYDNDGDDDIYFVNGSPDVNKPDPKWRNALFRNNGGIFEDVTNIAGVGDTGFGMCALFGDVDNDGWLDIFVGNYGNNVLYHNNGDGTFSDMTHESGIDDDRYAASASFADVDHDGDLDLFVGNYIDFDVHLHGTIQTNYQGQQVLMGPMAFASQRDILYINNGQGKFKDVSTRAGINISLGRAMGSVFFDLENDGFLDLYVTNDSTYNHLLRNLGDGRFEDLSYLSGAGFSDDGRGGASMGVSTDDYNNDGLLDLLITSYELESDILYCNEGNGLLTETTARMGLFAVTRKLVTWGNGFCDFNSDGYLDIYTVNGHVYPQVEALNSHKSYAQGVSIYKNNGEKYEDISEHVVPDEVMDKSCRGSALLDYDNDGDMDIVVNCIDSTPILLENRSTSGNWLQIHLKGTSAETYGVRVTARQGNKNWTRIVDGGSGYLSQNSSILHFGFGEVDQLDTLTIYWHHREPQVIQSPKLNRRMVIEAQ